MVSFYNDPLRLYKKYYIFEYSVPFLEALALLGKNDTKYWPSSLKAANDFIRDKGFEHFSRQQSATEYASAVFSIADRLYLYKDLNTHIPLLYFTASEFCFIEEFCLALNFALRLLEEEHPELEVKTNYFFELDDYRSEKPEVVALKEVNKELPEKLPKEDVASFDNKDPPDEVLESIESKKLMSKTQKIVETTKSSVVTGAAHGLSYDLGREMTKIVISGSPAAVGDALERLPEPLRVFVVSTLVVAAAEYAPIPAREAVAKVAANAQAGSATLAFTLLDTNIFSKIAALGGRSSTAEALNSEDLKKIVEDAVQARLSAIEPDSSAKK